MLANFFLRFDPLLFDCCNTRQVLLWLPTKMSSRGRSSKHVPEILATMFGALSVAVSLLKIHKLMLRFCLERCLFFGVILE
jgi:hypothetical protein